MVGSCNKAIAFRLTGALCARGVNQRVVKGTVTLMSVHAVTPFGHLKTTRVVERVPPFLAVGIAVCVVAEVGPSVASRGEVVGGFILGWEGQRKRNWLCEAESSGRSEEDEAGAEEVHCAGRW